MAEQVARAVRRKDGSTSPSLTRISALLLLHAHWQSRSRDWNDAGARAIESGGRQLCSMTRLDLVNPLHGRLERSRSPVRRTNRNDKPIPRSSPSHRRSCQATMAPPPTMDDEVSTHLRYDGAKPLVRLRSAWLDGWLLAWRVDMRGTETSMLRETDQ
ncbi:hypothetical protein IE81DRAFT_9473 [Ceraceosorus guamensis]|uniref:Uncharacterized protein n=1 Tax=Ceraceosorus guamensis TaxID=1522189 RepID=A0A316W5Z5_9BASI|nr:hypothetical protein IE81DRAFT_9473 [Ceraceosorus guamensis]PWN44518.1 hypothetical protein IE81DRAFT_9473 [Ceraceosorus guamensis]